MIARKKPSSGNGLRWYVVCARPHAETRAFVHLKRQGFQTFLPLYRKTIRHARQFRTVNAPLFPRYLFVALNLDRDRWRSVNGTFGVSRLIMEGERPKSIRSGVVEHLIVATDPYGLVLAAPDLKPGEKVRFASGPFAGLVGELLALDDDGRVRVLLEVMGAQIPVRTHRLGMVSAA